MSHARMVRFLDEKLLQDRDRLLAVGSRVIVGRLGGDQRKRVEGAGFDVVGIVCVQTSHRLGIRGGPSLYGRRRSVDHLAVVHLVGVPVESGGGINVFVLARSFRAHLLGFCQLGAPFFQVVSAGMLPELMVETHGETPMRHAVLRILSGSLPECRLRLLIFEGVQPRDGLIEGRLRFCIAGNRKRHLTHTFGSFSRRAISVAAPQKRARHKSNR